MGVWRSDGMKSWMDDEENVKKKVSINDLTKAMK